MVSNLTYNNAHKWDLSTDIDECTDGTHNCNANAECSNTEGSFTCDCNDGYAGNGTDCQGYYAVILQHDSLCYILRMMILLCIHVIP